MEMCGTSRSGVVRGSGNYRLEASSTVPVE